MQVFAVAPARFEAATDDETVDLQRVCAQRARAVPRAGGVRAEAEEIGGGEGVLELAEVVEEHLGSMLALRADGSGRGRPGSLQSVADAPARDGSELVAHIGERVRVRDVEADGEDGGEPADGAREIGGGFSRPEQLGDERLLATVAFHIEEHGVAASPLGERLPERGEERVVDARAGGCREALEQGVRFMSRQRGGHGARGGLGVIAARAVAGQGSRAECGERLPVR